MSSKLKLQGEETFDVLLNDDALVNGLAREAVQDALREHKRRGESVVVWQDGKAVRLSPEELLVDEAA